MLHHVPGRLCVPTQAFRCQPSRIEAAARQLVRMEGVDEVRINVQAGSITVRYDPAQQTQSELLAVIEALGSVRARQVNAAGTSEVTGLFGEALLGALAQTLAQRSVATLVGALR